MEDLFIGRQPIFDTNNNIYGYELLFRGGLANNASGIESDDEATATVVHNSMMGFTLEDLVGDARAFINFPETFFTPDVDPCFSTHRIVCEVLETVPVNDDTVAAIRMLKAQGFTIALDDFIFAKEYIPFIQLADIIKIDIEGMSKEKITLLISKVRKICQAKILVERVETKDIYQACLDAGCHYFQGYYFAKPEVITGRKMSVSSTHLFELLRRISNETISLEELEKIISQDVGLMHKLIKLAVQHRTSNMPEFDTLKQAMVLFGLKRVQSWATMISVDAMEDVLPEVFETAKTRAIFMRRCAEHEGLPNADSFYLAGMFSLLDVILHKSLEDAIAKLSLNEMIVNGLLHGQGDYGRLLAMVRAFEQSQSESLDKVYSQLYMESLKENHRLSML